MLHTTHRTSVLAILQAGGRGSRMDVLTRERAKPALPFAGHYQLIDFGLSSLAHSGISDVWLGVQYQATSLARHVANGRPWDPDRTDGGLQWLMPEEGSGPSALEGFSRGNADDLARRVDAIAESGADVVVVLSADMIFAVDLAEVVDEHRASKAACTVLSTEVSTRRAKAKAVLETDADGRVTGVEYKPERPKTGLVAAEIFVYDSEALVRALEELRARHADDAEDHTGLDDFGDTLLPYLIEHATVRSHPLPGYWRDLGTPADYLRGHRDVLRGEVDVLGRDDWPILSRFPEQPPARVGVGAVVEGSMICAGCDVRGTVRDSVLGPGVSVAEGAVVEDSVIFARTRIEAGATVATSIVDAHCVIGAGARVGALGPDDVEDEHIVLVGAGARVGDGVRVAAGARLEPGSRA